jgi:acyl-lipid omega-6 desaturase (Delta-12 desaturase)
MVQALSAYVAPDTRKGVQIFATDYLLFLAGMALALFAEHPALRLMGSLFAGLKLNGLYTVGHDAGHGVLTGSRRLNKVLACLCYMPALFSYRLWHHDHQVIHHIKTNGPQIDVYRPLSLAQYRAAPWWRKAWERLVRSFNPFGFAAYITYHSRIEQSKVFPHRAEHPEQVRTEAWLSSAVVVCYLGALLTWLWVRNAGEAAGFAGDVFFALVLPFFVFMNAVAIGVYLQHTHPGVPWFGHADEHRSAFDQAHLTVNFELPAFMEYLTHDVMAHQAHHVLPAIPCYRLRSAQKRLTQMLGDDCITARASDVFAIFRACKLYDFENRRWLDFNGQPTTDSVPLPTGSAATTEVAALRLAA